MPLYALGELSPQIDPDAFIHPDAVVIGAVTVGPGASIWPGAVLRGDTNAITIGEQTNVQDGVVIHTALDWPTRIADRVTIGHLAHLEGAEVGTGALIGAGSIVLAGARIGAHALVGAGALIPPGIHVPARARALGVPARITEDAVAEWPARINYENYVALARRYATELRRLD
jgi:carbonic anhydrase/acetyltransferase-like protein (isoleucine patch superfamily)